MFLNKKGKKFAFTLAETLITLVIIGVVAAITLPVITENYTRHAATDKIKKFYSTMNQVVLKAQADGNNWDDWATSTDITNDSTSATTRAFVDNYIAKYMVYTEVKEKGAYTYVYLNDGTYFYTYKGNCLDFLFDTNGDKRPNAEGRDIFRFLYCPYTEKGWIASGKVIPYQPISVKTRSQAMNLCKSNGAYCSALLSIDNWEFKSDYPKGI